MKGRPRSLRFEAKHGTRKVVHRVGNAARTIGSLRPGDRVTGVTAGQWSAIDALEHMVDELGRSEVRVTAWTSGIWDAERVRAIRVDGRISETRFLLDRGPFEKSPKYAGQLIEKLGVDAFRCCAVHSKVVIVDGERGSAVMRSSMGFNKNLRIEQFDIDVDVRDSGGVSDFYRSWFDAMWVESGRARNNRAIIKAVYDRYLSDREEEEAQQPAAQGEKAEDGDGGEASVSLDESWLWT